ncbi:STAS domain-containing protein [Nonomuraea sp. NPDC050310]|uniref:STAS domain-containing protein n=1 Tax=Nonomuraea sp. NPDC050310 TaxID=3154935 RepID=UPI003411AFC6
MTTLTTETAQSGAELGQVVVRLAGELDVSTAPLLGAVVQDALGEAPKQVVIDVESLTFCDSNGLEALLDARDAAAAAGAGFRLSHVHGTLQRVLDATGLDAAFSKLTQDQGQRHRQQG